MSDLRSESNSRRRFGARSRDKIDSMDPIWFSYVGAIAGAAGAITGIAGVLISVYSYRRVSAIKALDLRIEARRCYNDAALLLESVTELKERAEGSRKVYAAAAGIYKSGAMEKWEQQWVADQQSIAVLKAKLDAVGKDYQQLRPSQIEDKLVEIHRLTGRLKGLHEKYTGELAWDETRTKELRAERLASMPDRTTRYDT